MKHISDFESGNTAGNDLPDWVPDDARAYLEHVTNGRSMRDVARASGGHASTISRHVQKLEARRDEPLVDGVYAGLNDSSSYVP
jgi:hypothetical protein